MDEVTSPRITFRKLGLRVGAAAGLLALTGSLVASPAVAEDLGTLRDRAAAAARQAADAKARAADAAAQAAAAKKSAANASAKVGVAQTNVQGSQQKVQSADAVLDEAERALASAQQKLFDTRQELQDARDYDAKLAADLAEARDRLAAARTAVEDGQQRVDAQRQLMGAAAREAWQQQTPLEGLSVLLGATTPEGLSQRVQWQDTVFDTQMAEKAKLDVLVEQLRAARDEQTQVEAKIATDKAAAAAQVDVVEELTRRAAAEEAEVQALVAKQQAALKAAQAQLASDQTLLSAAKTTQVNAQQALDTAQGELAASKAELDRAEAEAAQREQRVKSEIARQKAREAASHAASTSSGGSGRETSGSAPHQRVSSYGFVRPIDTSPGSPFGMRFHPILHYWRMHNGTDFGASCGTPIYAARSGTVLQKGPDGGFGNYTLIGHGTIDGVYVTTGYAHQSRIIVREGQRVSRGQVIGYVGSTGLSTTCHLHFEIRHDGTPVNPLRYVP